MTMNDTYYPLPELIPEEYMSVIRTLNASLISDGLGKLGLDRGGMDPAISPVKEKEFMVGTAVTVKTSGGDNLPIHVASCLPGAGYVMVVDGEAYDQCAYAGELLCTAVMFSGYEGIVLDGYIRDRDELQKMALPVYARGYMTSGPVKKEPGAINVPVMCGGKSVAPGDLIFGSSDGITVVPRQLIPAVLEKALEKADYETDRKLKFEQYRKAKASGAEPPDLRPAWLREMDLHRGRG